MPGNGFGKQGYRLLYVSTNVCAPVVLLNLLNALCCVDNDVANERGTSIQRANYLERRVLIPHGYLRFRIEN